MEKPITRSRSQLPASSSTVPFRSRKIKKLSHEKTDTATNGSKTHDHAVSVPVTKPLSADGEIDMALKHLKSSDPLLVALIDAQRPPTFDSGSPPFQSITKSILYQQLAPAAARSIYARFIALCGGESEVLPGMVLSLPANVLREIGVSGRKAGYIRDLADKYQSNVLSDSLILQMDDDELLNKLTSVKGIGVWSVHMFMMFSLHRPDVLPVGDLGVRKGVQSLYGLKRLPLPAEMQRICEKWKPYRSVGSWYMWRLMEAKTMAKSVKK